MISASCIGKNCYLLSAAVTGMASSSYLLGVYKIGCSPRIHGFKTVGVNNDGSPNTVTPASEMRMRDVSLVVGGFSLLTLLCCNILGIAMPDTMSMEILGSINLSIVGLNLVVYALCYRTLSNLKAKKVDALDKEDLRIHQIYFATVAIVQITLNASMLAGFSYFTMDMIAWTYVGSGIAMTLVILSTIPLETKTSQRRILRLTGAISGQQYVQYEKEATTKVV